MRQMSGVSVFAILVFAKKGESAVELAAEKELSQFGYFQRGRCDMTHHGIYCDSRGTDGILVSDCSIGEFMSFFARTVVERTAPGTRQSVKEQSTSICMCRI